MLDRTGKTEAREQRLATAVLRQWAEENAVVDLWRFIKPTARDHSFYSTRHKTFSRIDLIFASQDIFANIHKIDYIPTSLSDHNAVICKATIRIELTRTARWRFNIMLLKTESFLLEMKE